MSSSKTAVTGGLAERNVQSVSIKNQTSDQIHCLVEYQTLSGSDNEVIEFDMDGNGEEHECEEKVQTMSTTHPTNSSYSNTYPKVIYSLQVQKSDGTKLEVQAPFANVPHGNARNWKFIVEDNQIRSEKDFN